MKELAFAFAVAAAIAAAILAAAVYKTWTEDNMMIVTIAGSISCVVVPAILAAVLSWRVVDYHFDSKESKQRTKQNAELLQEMQVLKASSLAQYNAQRVQTETFRTGRLASLLQAPQQITAPTNGVVDDPWLLGIDEDDNETVYV